MKYEYIHVHKDLGGLGIDKLEDAVGYEKLKILLKGLNGKGKFGTLMREATERLQHYTQSNKNPLEQSVQHVQDNNDMWLLTLKQWMEAHDITIKTEMNNVYTLNCEQDSMVVDAMQTVKGKKLHGNGYKNIN